MQDDLAAGEPATRGGPRSSTSTLVGPEQAGELRLTTTAPVAGGAALARDDSGRVVFVTGALPGETVDAIVTEQRRDFARALVIRVLDVSPDRVSPPCPAVALGCGGCDLQHVHPEAQVRLKRDIVIDALRRQGRLPEPPVETGAPLPSAAFRTTVRLGVVDGRPGFRAARSHEIVDLEHCLVAHPLLDELLAGEFHGVDEVTLRVGAATGERLVLGSPTADGIELPTGTDAIVVGADQLADGKHAWIHDVVHGHTFRISARSFFQTRTDGAAALVDAVRELGGDELRGARTVVDAYAGVGLFGALVAPDGAKVIAVESSPSSIADARYNLADRGAKIIRSEVERWRPSAADVVVADPARTGLGRRAAEVLAATHASTLVLVSCDAAALGRDARLLADHGFRLEVSRLVDLFPHTHHVEVVSRFVR